MLDGTSVPVPRSRRAVPAGALLTAMSPLMAQAGRIRVRVTDPTDGVVPGAEISLVGADYKPVQTQRADRVGEAAFTGLPMGNCRIVVSSPGFKTKSVSVVIQNGEELRVEARLEIGAITMGTIVEAMQPVTGRVRIQIKDATGMAIAAAQGSILDAAGKPTRTVPANSAGEVVFTDLPLGDCGFVVWSIGFENRRVYLSLRSADEVQIQTTLEVGTAGTVIRVPR